jgi:putative ABC transport system permease protein
LRLTVAPIHADSVREVDAALTALFVGSSFILLICCVNVASLLLARASERRKEIALRLSLGASLWRILRQLLVEGGLLCAISGVAGTAVAWRPFAVCLPSGPSVSRAWERRG